MKAENHSFATVDEYIASFPPRVRDLLTTMRYTIVKAAPAALEVISYNMPAYKLQGMLAYFAGYEKHIGFYPMPSAIKKFAAELAIYKTAKGSIRFPLDQKIPVALVTKIIRFRKEENLLAAAIKTTKKKTAKA